MLVLQISSFLMATSFIFSVPELSTAICLKGFENFQQVSGSDNSQNQPGIKRPPFTFPKFDEYGEMPFAEEKQRLDYLAVELRSVLGEQAYIIEYRNCKQGQKALRRAKRAKKYLVSVRGIPAKRIVVVDGGYQEEFKIELRLGPISLR